MPDTIAVRLRPRTLAVESGAATHHFDRSGRLTFSTSPGETVRRSLDDRALRVSISSGTRKYQWLAAEDKTQWYKEALALAAEAVRANAAPTIREWACRIAKWSPERLALDAQAFSRVYLPISILPPDQYHTLVVQIAQGCSYNRCLFCDFYRDRPFRIKTSEELDAHIAGLRSFFAERLPDRSGVFLGDGNALVVPTDRLLAMMDGIQRKLTEAADSFSTFMDTFTLERKTLAELTRIRQAGLTTVYSGLETGSDRLRAILRKPGAAQEAAHALTQLKAAGFRLGVIVLVGAGGPSFAAEHLLQTKRILETIDLSPRDIVFLSPFVEPPLADYRAAVRAGRLSAFTDAEIAQETARWRTALDPLDAKVTVYSLREYMYW